MCQDPPQIFDMRLAPGPRAADRDRVVAERQRAFPDTYAPFTIDEYRAMPLDYSYLDQCVAWPVSPPGHPASQVVPADAAYPDIPALILSGEFDNITTMAEGEAVAKAFKHGRQIRLANSFHVNALPRARSACGAEIVRRFIATLEPGDVGCAAAGAPAASGAAFRPKGRAARARGRIERQLGRRRVAQVGQRGGAHRGRRAHAARQQFNRRRSGTARRQLPNRTSRRIRAHDA